MAGLKAPKGNFSNSEFKKQEPLEPGSYPGRLVQVIDLGVQAQKPYKGQDKPPVHMIMTTYELVDTFMLDEDGEEMEDKPRWISETFPLHSLNSDLAKSTKRYKALDPDLEHDGDWTELIGSPANITIAQNEHDGKVYENISAVTPMRPKEVAKLPELKNDPRVFSMENPDMELWEKIPQWIREKIQQSLNFSATPLAGLVKGVKAEKKAEKVAKKAEPDPDMAQGDEEEDAPW